MTAASDPPGNNSSKATSDEERAYIQYGEQLRKTVSVVLEPWLAAQIHGRHGIDPRELEAEIRSVVADADARLEELIYADVETPLSGPLERIRGAVEQLAPALLGLGAVPPTRDPFDVQIRPDDQFALGPLTFADLGEDVHQAGITWGAAKAYLHNVRRK